MTPIMQTRFDVGHGNCLNACVATILGSPLGCDGVPEEKGALRGWLYDRDLGIAWVKPAGVSWPSGDALHIVAGQSLRHPDDPCAQHAVVCGFDGRGNRTWLHDPHPEGAFTGGSVAEVGFIVRLGVVR